MDGSAVEQILSAHIVEEFLEGELAELPPSDASLIDAEIIDSLGILVLVDFVEARFGIVVEPHEVVLENFESVVRLRDFVRSKMVSSAAG